MCFCTVLASSPPRFFFFFLGGGYLRAISKYKPAMAEIQRSDSMESFCVTAFEGLIFGGAYFRNSTVV